MYYLKYLVLVLCIGLMGIEQVHANALTISSVERLEAPNKDQVRFNISWQNSWRVGGTPGNHDAVWVFVKYKPCEGTQSQFSHALLSTTMTDHQTSSEIEFARPILVTDRYAEGTGHNTGALIRRAAFGLGNVTDQTVTLRIVGGTDGNDFDADLDYNIEVFGIEMVWVPEGGFRMGDQWIIDNQNRTHSFNPVDIGVEDASIILVRNWGGSSSASSTLTARYPKGVQEFFCMKYEISAGQYVDFLNNVGSNGSIRHDANYDENRHTIQIGGTGYEAVEPNRANNWMSVQDVLAYLDWAALRPMTELEYEKACKGGAFQSGGHAWGSRDIVIEALRIETPEDGTERVLTTEANLHHNGTTNEIEDAGGTSLGGGPLGCGIFARDGNENRLTSGATYWGIMEMSGNVYETVVSAQGTASWSSSATMDYEGIWGDGQLSAFGMANVAGWPDQSTNGNYGVRGGSWRSGIERCRVSDRLQCIAGQGTMASNYSVRHNHVGGRGVR